MADEPRAALTCPYCKGEIDNSEENVACRSCGTLHHADCWNQNGMRCTVFACASIASVQANTDDLTRATARAQLVVERSAIEAATAFARDAVRRMEQPVFVARGATQLDANWRPDGEPLAAPSAARRTIAVVFGILGLALGGAAFFSGEEASAQLTGALCLASMIASSLLGRYRARGMRIASAAWFVGPGMALFLYTPSWRDPSQLDGPLSAIGTLSSVNWIGGLLVLLGVLSLAPVPEIFWERPRRHLSSPWRRAAYMVVATAIGFVCYKGKLEGTIDRYDRVLHRAYNIVTAAKTDEEIRKAIAICDTVPQLGTPLQIFPKKHMLHYTWGPALFDACLGLHDATKARYLGHFCDIGRFAHANDQTADAGTRASRYQRCLSLYGDYLEHFFSQRRAVLERDLGSPEKNLAACAWGWRPKGEPHGPRDKSVDDYVLSHPYTPLRNTPFKFYRYCASRVVALLNDSPRAREPRIGVVGPCERAVSKLVSTPRETRGLVTKDAIKISKLCRQRRGRR